MRDVAENTIAAGLSPLARGTHRKEPTQRYSHRFIPASAGNTRQKALSEFYDAVYPRWRGEHSPGHYSTRNTAGLSPLARGTPLYRFCAFCRVRFIPAGAGNTLTAFDAREIGGGLSQLARGTHGCRFFPGRILRFIPAGAGNTSFPTAINKSLAVYPRWRGEHTKHTYLFLNKFISHQQSTN